MIISDHQSITVSQMGGRDRTRTCDLTDVSPGEGSIVVSFSPLWFGNSRFESAPQPELPIPIAPPVAPLV
jgi:hypothetical protein